MDPEIEAAKFVAEKTLEALGAAVYRSSMCQDLDKQTPVIAYFCKLIGGATGAGVEQWREEVTKRLEDIKQTLVTVSAKVDLVNQGVKTLLTRTALLDLELAKVLQGQQAYKYLQEAQSYYQAYNELAARVGVSDNVKAWQGFYSDVINKYTLPEHLDVVKTAITTPLLDKDALLRTFVKGILIKAGAGSNSTDQLLDFYNAYETYVSSVLIEMRKGYLLYSQAILFFETMAGQGKPAMTLPMSGATWAARRDTAVKEIIDTFLSELMWLILGLSWAAVGGTNPYFLVPAAREMVARGLRFAVRSRGEAYGLRGVVVSMGDKFSGALTAGGVALPAPTKYQLLTEDEADWWTASASDGVYDEFRVSNAWNVYVYSLPDATPKSYELSQSFPYPTAPVDVQRIDEISGKPVNGNAASVNFGSFLEVERAGGGFALLSGGWNGVNLWAPSPDASTSRNPFKKIDYVSSRVQPVGLSDGARHIGATSALQATIVSAGEVEWNFGSLWMVWYLSRFQSQKTIRSAAGGQFQIEGELRQLPEAWMHGGWTYYAPTWLYAGPEWSHWSHERLIADPNDLNGKMVVRKLWYNPSTAAYGCYLHPRVSAYVSAEGDIGRAAPPAGAPAAQWDLDVDTSKNVKDDFSVSDPVVSFKGVLAFAPGAGYHVYVEPRIDVKVETSGMDYTPYLAYLGFQLTNLRIVRRADRKPSA